MYSWAIAQLEEIDAATVTSRAYTVLQGLGFSRKRIDGPFASLSGGWKARVALAAALLQHCEILLLDEPVNYLDMPTILWLERFVANINTTVVTVAHDVEVSGSTRYSMWLACRGSFASIVILFFLVSPLCVQFLNAVTDQLIILKKEKLHYFDGNLFEYERQMHKNQKHSQKQQDALDKKREILEKSIKEGKRQARKTGDENRQKMTKSRERKLQDRWGIEANSSGHRFKLNRDLAGYHLTSRDTIEVEEAQAGIQFSFPNPLPLRFAGSLLHVENLSYSYNQKVKVLQQIHLTMELGDRVGLVGPNGQGKSTLIELIMGKRNPTAGTITFHSRIKIAYYAQNALTSSSFQECKQTALEHFLENAQSNEYQTERMARSFLAQFDLKARSVDAITVSKLSGGQKVKLILSEMMCCGPHLVVFDEVTS